jgi:hypothetical protein
MKNTSNSGFARAAEHRRADSATPEAPAPARTAREVLPRARDDRRMLSIRIDAQLRNELKAKTAREGTSVQEVLTDAIYKYLNQQ